MNGSTETNAADLTSWASRPLPDRLMLEGRYTRLEPLNVARHGADLFLAATAEGAADRFRYLFDSVPVDEPGFTRWLEAASTSLDPLFFAVIDKATGRAEGRQALMRVDVAHGVIEIGNILWGPAMARTRVATEAFRLFASYAFDDLGYRRLEWKCDDRNMASKRAAERFGFSYEGLFRQHMVVKGENRDTAWFSITDVDWPEVRTALDRWLDPANFDKAGRQKHRLEANRS